MTTPLTREERDRLRGMPHQYLDFGMPCYLCLAISTIDSLEAQVKEAEAQRDNDVAPCARWSA